MDKHELENRLINFSVRIIQLIKSLPDDITCKTISNQIVRSGTSSALNYGEAQSAESKRDFIHKLKIVLKELRETLICLEIIKRANLTTKILLHELIKENNELISIFVRSISTAAKKNKNQK